jgi:hypothetical protein
MAIYTIRLDDESDEILARGASVRGVSRATILREALSEYGKRAGGSSDHSSGWAPLIGAVKDGPGNLSERTSARFAEELLRARATSAKPSVTEAPKARRTTRTRKAR